MVTAGADPTPPLLGAGGLSPRELLTKLWQTRQSPRRSERVGFQHSAFSHQHSAWPRQTQTLPNENQPQREVEPIQAKPLKRRDPAREQAVQLITEYAAKKNEAAESKSVFQNTMAGEAINRGGSHSALRHILLHRKLISSRPNRI